jgi:hypothetical protein
MPRGLTSNMQAETAKKVVRPAVFYQGEFVSGTVYLWSGVGTRTWNGHDWLGAGQLAGLSAISESGGMNADGLVCTLSGIPNDLLTKALSELRHSKKATLWLACLDANDAIVTDPFQLFSGVVDAAVVRRGRKSSTIAITYENRSIDGRARSRRYTNEDQQIDFPGDTGLKYINDLQDKTLDPGVGTGGGVGIGIPINVPTAPADDPRKHFQ